jgi:hypothetical protein
VRAALPSLRLAVDPLERFLAGGDASVPPPIAAELRTMLARLRELEGIRVASTLRREGEYWTIVHDAAVLRVRDRKGMGHLAHLLAHPEVAVHAASLEGEAPGARATAAARLDPAAKAAYRARIDDLRGEISDAQRRVDPARAERHQAELDALLHELAAGVGLGGRDRGFASAGERARVNVTRNLRATIDRIRDGHAALGRHLATSVRTGTFCCYAPDPAAAIRWLVAP